MGTATRSLPALRNDRTATPGGRRVGPRGPSLKSQIPKPLMEKLYVEQELSLQDITDLYGCTRVLVYLLMKDYEIPHRSHSKARRIAQRAGKVQYTVQLANGGSRRIKQEGTNIHEGFFREWSPEMAYVLGVLYSDGCRHVKRNGYHSASISQKEPDDRVSCQARRNGAPFHPGMLGWRRMYLQVRPFPIFVAGDLLLRLTCVHNQLSRCARVPWDARGEDPLRQSGHDLFDHLEWRQMWEAVSNSL